MLIYCYPLLNIVLLHFSPDSFSKLLFMLYIFTCTCFWHSSVESGHVPAEFRGQPLPQTDLLQGAEHILHTVYTGDANCWVITVTALFQRVHYPVNTADPLSEENSVHQWATTKWAKLIKISQSMSVHSGVT